MKKVFLLLIIFSTISLTSISQDYNAAIGFRAGVNQGITFKDFVGRSSAFDLIFSNYHYGLFFTALYENHNFDIFSVPNLALFYGFGGHVGYYNSAHWPSNWHEHSGDAVVFGADIVVGVEYTFEPIPISISLDIVPSLNIIPYMSYWQKGALSIRYVFK